jgi:hypothetical protein
MPSKKLFSFIKYMHGENQRGYFTMLHKQNAAPLISFTDTWGVELKTPLKSK